MAGRERRYRGKHPRQKLPLFFHRHTQDESFHHIASACVWCTAVYGWLCLRPRVDYNSLHTRTSYARHVPLTRTRPRPLFFQALGSKVDAALDKGAADAKTIVQLNGRIKKLEGELKLARSEIKNLEGLGEMDRAEIEGLQEDLAVQSAGWEAECEEKEEAKAEAEQRTKERDEANDQLEFLEGELEGVRAEEVALRAEVKSQNEELQDLTNARDDLDDEVGLCRLNQVDP
jgi:predicted  nucleic acid-binding Zn-ribbon protein